MIRINPADATVRGGSSVGVKMGALQALTLLANALRR